MRARELIRYSRGFLKGRRSATAAICVFPLFAELFFRFAEAAVYSLLLYFGEMQPVALFRAESRMQLAVVLLCTIFRWITVYPLGYAAAFRLCDICTDDCKRRKVPFSRVLMNRRSYKRSLAAALWSKLVGCAALLPAVFFGVTAYSLINSSLDANGVFMAVHAIVLTAVSAAIWISCRLSLSAVPYLLVKFPKKSPLRTVLYSLRSMRGRRGVIVRIGAMCLPLGLTVVGIPAAVTRFKAAYALAIDIFIREDEYAARKQKEEAAVERDKTDSGYAGASAAEKLSHRKKRRLKENAGKA